MARRLLGNLALTAVALLLTLVALEALLRLVEPRPTLYSGRGLYQPDADLGHVLRPGVDDGAVRTNAFGFRGHETALAKPAGTRRVLGIGDSFTFGSSYP